MFPFKFGQRTLEHDDSSYSAPPPPLYMMNDHV